MANENVLVVNAKSSDADLFKHYLLSEHFNPLLIADLASASQELQEKDILLTLMDYHLITRTERSDVVGFFKKVEQAPLVLYNVPRNAAQRMAFYDLGASRVFDSNWLTEEVYYSIRLWLQRLVKQQEKTQDYSTGRLEDINLATLINTIGKEDQTGLLKILTDNNSGKIYFYKGHIDDATVGLHRGMRAVIQMLYWKAGVFSFTTIPNYQPTGEIYLSNIGLMLLGEKFRHRLLQRLEHLGDKSSVVRIQNEGDLTNTDMDIKPEFVEYLKRPKPLTRLLENPFYTSDETVERLIQLRDSGYLLINKPYEQLVEDTFEENLSGAESGLEEIVFSEEDIQIFKEILGLREAQKGKLIVVSADWESKAQFIKRLTRTQLKRDNRNKLDVAKVKLAHSFELFILGMTMDDVEVDKIKSLFEGLAGYVFLIDAQRSEAFEYQRYIINALLNIYPVPSVLAVFNQEGDTPAEDIKKIFENVFDFHWLNYNPELVSDIRDILLHLRPVHKKLKTKSQTEKSETKDDE